MLSAPASRVARHGRVDGARPLHTHIAYHLSVTSESPQCPQTPCDDVPAGPGRVTVR